MNPPRSGPAAKPSALTALQMPIAFGCSSGVKICIATASVVVSSSAPPTPMPARAAINCPVESASPAATEPIAEQDETRDQHLLAAVAVGRAARREQQPGLHQRVRVDHPLDVGGARAQLPGEGGDRDVQHGVVEQHGELREADDTEDQPALGVALAGGLV